ncbi:MAG: anaerobic ribonucleoside-triphosphate reductase activating protein [Betaproteobacteria bacterium]
MVDAANPSQSLQDAQPTALGCRSAGEQHAARNPCSTPFCKGGSPVQQARPVSGHHESEATLRVAGLTPLSTTDFPGQLAAVVFVQGCAWRCRYCHNPEIQSRREAPERTWQSVLDFLDRRHGLLDAVVFCGGEPTVDRQLSRAIDDVRQRGFKVGLHTAGIYPGRLRALLPKLDWVGFDVKAPFDDYARTTGVRASGTPARESLEHLLASGVAHEVRTTHHPALLPADKLKSMAAALRHQGVRTFALQEFRPHGCADASLDSQPPPLADDDAAYLRQLFPTFILRRAN